MNIFVKPFVSDSFKYNSSHSAETLTRELTTFSNKPFWNVDESDILGKVQDDGSFIFMYRRSNMFTNRRTGKNASLTLTVLDAPHGSEVQLVADPSFLLLIIPFISAAFGLIVLYSRISGTNTNDNMIWVGLGAFIVIPVLIMYDNVKSKTNIVADVVAEFNLTGPVN